MTTKQKYHIQNITDLVKTSSRAPIKLKLLENYISKREKNLGTEVPPLIMEYLRPRRRND